MSLRLLSTKVYFPAFLSQTRHLSIQRNVFREPMYYDANNTPKIMTANEVAESIPSGSHIFLHTGVCFPKALVIPLQSRVKNGDVKGINLYYGDILTHDEITEKDIFKDIHFTLFSAGKGTREAIETGHADFVPIFLSELPALFQRQVINLDYAFVQLSPPNNHGYCTMGPSVDYSRAACQYAKKVIGIVNKNMPCVNGDGIVHVSQLNGIVYDDTLLPNIIFPKPSMKDLQIARFVAENLVENGCTLQLGVGQIMNCITGLLKHHKDLGVHSELITDGIIDLVETGVFNNRMKVIDQGKTTSSLAIGSYRLYDYINDNASIVLREIDYTNDYRIIGKNPFVTCVNSCTQIDLTGQIVADSIGTRILSGVGGQIDFVTGACRSDDRLGRPIIVMHSTNKEGKSKILPILDKGSGVVTTRYHARYIVTEYGIADLFGKTLLQRAYQLIKIAHPDHRKELEEAAFERFKEMPTM